MTHGSLFSGIGGFDLAAEWMGWENKFHCEWNDFGQKVLKHYWPNAESFHDITKTDFTKYANRISVLTGGFPCQPYSLAGRRKGKDDERHLWPEMCRAIREIKPRWVIGENVLGLVNWSGGLVFHEVQADLEAQGYEVFPYLLNAASVGAPHKRDRIWFVAFNTKSDRGSKVGKICKRQNNEPIGICKKDFVVAYSNNNGFNQCDCGDEIQSSEGRINALGDINESNGNGDAADTSFIRCDNWSNNWQKRHIQDDIRSTKENKSKWNRWECGIGKVNTIITNTDCEMLEHGNGEGKTGQRAITEKRIESFSGTRKWETFPTVSPICDGNDGISDRLDSITFSKWRKESIKAGGNAIVPQVAFQIFKTIEQFEQLNKQA